MQANSFVGVKSSSPPWHRNNGTKGPSNQGPKWANKPSSPDLSTAKLILLLKEKKINSEDEFLSLLRICSDYLLHTRSDDNQYIVSKDDYWRVTPDSLKSQQDLGPGFIQAGKIKESNKGLISDFLISSLNSEFKESFRSLKEAREKYIIPGQFFKIANYTLESGVILSFKGLDIKDILLRRNPPKLGNGVPRS
jgi:hypothetical protein